LPHYMVPGQIVALDALPRTPNGKVDRRALLAMRHDYTLPAANFAAASTALESVLADIWKEVLGVEQVSIHDSFVDLGGYSLLAVQVTARVKKKTGVTLDPGQMMIQTLGQLAAMLEGPAAPSKP
jgi:acyl carrier protein